jgi:hypothetical protein
MLFYQKIKRAVPGGPRLGPQVHILPNMAATEAVLSLGPRLEIAARARNRAVAAFFF